jgi:hypothetical protein
MAVGLADERVGQLAAARWDGSGDCLGLSPSPDLPPLTAECPGRPPGYAPFPDEAAGALPAPFERFARAARVQSCVTEGVCPAASPDLRLVTVVVSFPRSSVAVSRLVGRKP